MIKDVIITDTSRLTSEQKLVIAATPGAVIAQEAQGQRELAESAQLPVEGLLGEDRPQWEALGVKILDEASGDPLFCHVELPPGWHKVPTDHPLWTNLVDGSGKVHAKIVYKAAFYDRYARISLRADPVECLALDCVCSVCGHEQASMDPCERCQSVRVVSIAVIRDLLGEDWRSAFAPKTEAP